ncbi:transporter substrate-binding domain-containing protein [Thiolapillus sp.]
MAACRQNIKSRPFIVLLLFCLGLLTTGTASSHDVSLSHAEEQWLKQHPVIRIGPDPGYPPFEWLDENGHYQGIAADYIALMEKKLGVHFQVVPTHNWSEVIQLARERKIDLLPALAQTRQRKSYLVFTHPYDRIPGIVVSIQGYDSINELLDKRIAVVSDTYWDDLLSDKQIDIQIQHVDNTEFGMELAAMGAVDAMVTDLASATAIIKQTGISNLHVIRDPQKRLGSLEITMGIRSDWPELQAIINKTLASITPQERDTIRSKWINIQQPAFWRDRNFLIGLFTVLGVILLLFAGVITWNRMLKHKVEARTRELNAAQTKLMQAEKMESIGRLAAGIAHEVKNPLAIIQMGMDYLAQEIPRNPTNTEVKKDIDDAVQRANTVIHGLLDFSRDKQLQLQTGSVNTVIQDTLHLVDHELKNQRNITTRLSLAKTLPDMAMDRNKLQQVFINLFMNAAQAMEHDGELWVTTREVVIDRQAQRNGARAAHFHSGEQAIEVEIADNGPGIRPQDKEKIFELFYTTKAVGEGTGLGLSVTRNIINLHHGSIDIDNRPEGGTSVILLFRTINRENTQ